jgi:hypothetical protein
VKTLTDVDRSKVNLQPEQVTVSWLVSREPPRDLPEDARVPPIETQTYRVSAALVAFKIEADHDFHIVIADLQNPTDTMIVEMPDPACKSVCASPALGEIRQARQDFVTHCGEPTPKLRRFRKRVSVTVMGVGFFDFLHGQTGVADNGIELHPVMKIEFPTGPNDCAG